MAAWEEGKNMFALERSGYCLTDTAVNSRYANGEIKYKPASDCTKDGKGGQYSMDVYDIIQGTPSFVDI